MTEDRKFEILVVAKQREHVRLLKTNLDLMNEDFRVTDALSGEEAQLEFSTHFDLLITEYSLSGMSGAELIYRASQRMPDMQAIIKVDPDDGDIYGDIEGLPVYAILDEIEAGSFSHAVRMALFGEQEEQVIATGGTGRLVDPKLGDIPHVDLEEITKLLDPQVRALGCIGIAFTSRAGHTMYTTGDIPERMRFNEVSSFLANNLTNASIIADYIGPIPSTTMQYYDGKEWDIFTVSAGVHFFVTLIYPGDSQKELGAVMRFRRKIIWQVIDVIGLDVAMGTEGSGMALEALADLITDQIAEQVAEEQEKAREEEFVKDVLEAGFEEAPEEEGDLEDIFGLGEAEEAEEIALDIDDDFADLDSEMENLDDFWGDVSEDAGKIREDAISMEEAMELGFLDDLE